MVQTMKNYLIGAVRPVTKIWGSWKGTGDDPDQAGNLETYNKIYDISRLSAKAFLAGEWEEVKYTAPVLDARLFQIAQWYAIKELWFSEECNILAMGADTMFLKPTEVFGKYDKMSLFNYTDPKAHKEFEHYFNDDIRYYPATMDPDVWDIGERAMENWFDHDESDWACGQLIHNRQFWHQGVTLEEALRPEMAYQVVGDEDWNGIKATDAHIIHLHGSRSVNITLQNMESLGRQLGLLEEETILL